MRTDAESSLCRRAVLRTKAGVGGVGGEDSGDDDDEIDDAGEILALLRSVLRGVIGSSGDEDATDELLANDESPADGLVSTDARLFCGGDRFS